MSPNTPAITLSLKIVTVNENSSNRSIKTKQLFETSLVYRVNSRTAGATQRNPVFKGGGSEDQDLEVGSDA